MQYAIYGRSEGIKHVVQRAGGGQESKNKTNRGEERPLDDQRTPTIKHDAPSEREMGPKGRGRGYPSAKTDKCTGVYSLRNPSLRRQEDLSVETRLLGK